MMRTRKINYLGLLAISIWLIMSMIIIEAARAQADQQSSSNKQVFTQLRLKDSLLFDAVFNSCRISTVESILSDSFAFYPDEGASVYSSHQSRAEFLTGIEKNFCNTRVESKKMRRTVEWESAQIYPLSLDEVLQTGVQRFYMRSPGAQDKLVEVSKFTRTWQRINDDWKLSREFDSFSNTYANHPSQLYDTIYHMDSLLFDAFNAHDVDKLKSLFTTDLEFYHDLGGLTNYVENMESFKQNFAKNNGLHRVLVDGSLEVYPVKDYGAMEIGEHKFCHLENGRQDCGTFKFAMVWKRTENGWKISRVMSYGH
jgi:hypothetical protein